MSLDRLPLLSRKTITTFCFLSFHDHYRYVDVRFCILFYLRKHYYHILLIEEYTYMKKSTPRARRAAAPTFLVLFKKSSYVYAIVSQDTKRGIEMVKLLEMMVFLAD
jgi:hypothetical protein